MGQKEKEEKERLRRCGQLVVDFANAPTTDEACLGMIEQMGNAFDFMPEFAEGAKRVFPQLRHAKRSLSEPEKRLWDLYVEESKAFKSLKDQLEMFHTYIEDYDRKKRAITVVEYEFHPTSDDADHLDVDVSASKPYEVPLISPDPEEAQCGGHGWFLDVGCEPAEKKANQLLKIAGHIMDMEKQVAEEKALEIKHLSAAYSNIVAGHDRLGGFQKELNSVLEDVVEKENLYVSKPFRIFFNEFKNHCIPKPTLLPDDSFSHVLDFVNETDFLDRKVFKGSDWPLAYRRCLIYCLVEFLKTPKNRKLIRKCIKCQKFFLRSADNDRFVYCRACSPKDNRPKEKKAEQQRKWREKRKRLKQKQLCEARIKYYTENLGYSIKEAEEIIAADLEINKGM